MGRWIAIVALVFVVFGACTTLPPEETVTFNEEYVVNGPAMFENRIEISTRGEGNEYMVGIRAVSDDAGYIYYASRQDIDRELGEIREFGDIYRLDFETLELTPVTDSQARQEAAEQFSSYREFSYRKPTDEGLLSGLLGVGKIAYERNYNFEIVPDGDGGAGDGGALPVALSWVYDEDPVRLVLRFGRGRGSTRSSFPPEIFDLQNVGEPGYWRTLSAMRYRAATGHVTFFDSIVDLNERRRIRLIENTPTDEYVETIALSPSWTRMMVLYWKYRETKYLSVLEVTPPGDR